MATIKDILAGLLGVRETVSDVERKLTKARATVEELEAAPPHTDDIVGTLIADIDRTCAETKRRLCGGHFATEAAKQAARASHLENRGDVVYSLLALPRLSPNWPALLPSTGINHASGEVSILALTWLLSDTLKAKVPVYVAEAFPEAASAMPPAERRAKLAKARSDVVRLEGELAELVDALDKARRAAA